LSARPSLVLISGLSGAGRTTATKSLEDLGFYCVDNLPITMLEPFVGLFEREPRRLAAVVDVREGRFLSEFPEIHARLQAAGWLEDLLFLDASDEVLAKRFDETRRVHPAALDRQGLRAPSGVPGGSAGPKRGAIQEGIARERELLAPVAAVATCVLDTSQLTVHELRRRIRRRYGAPGQLSPLEVEVISFGFRYGAPEVADLMLDVRFLPNPNFEPELRERTGEDPEVAAFVLESPRTAPFLERFFDFLSFLLPLYAEEGKAYLTIAIGCTGGQHRSVAIAGALERYMGERKIDVHLTHRDVDRRSLGRPQGERADARDPATEPGRSQREGKA